MYILDSRGLGDYTPWRARVGSRSTPQSLRFMNLDSFVHNKTWLTDDHRNMLDILVKHVKASWETTQPIGFIHLIGHTDNTGEEKYNVGLGDQRAKEVEKVLLGKLRKQGLSDRVGIVVEPSPGKTKPTADNRTREGRARNRRVEVFIGGLPPKTLFDPRPVPPPPTAKQPPIDLWTLPEKTKRRIEERDEEQRYNKPVPPSPSAKTLEDWLDELLRRLPQHRRILGAILKGSCSLLEELFEREGGTLSDKQKEDFRKQCREAAKKPI